MAYSPPHGTTAITFNIPRDATGSRLPAYVTVALGSTPLNLSAPVSASDPVVITIDGTTQPDDALDPHRSDPTTTPKVAIRLANRSAPLAAAFVLGHGGPSSVSGAVTLRGLAVAGFGDATPGAIGGGGIFSGVAALQLWPSLTIEGCAFENNLPAAVTVVGAEGVPVGAVVIRHTVISQPPGSAGVGVSVDAAFNGSLSLSSVSVTGGSVGVRVQSIDARVRLMNVTVRSTAQIGLDMAAAGTAIVGGVVSGCGGDAGLVLRQTAVGSIVTGTVVRGNAGDGIDVYAAGTTVKSASVLGNRQDGINLCPTAVDSYVTATVIGNNTENGIRTQALRTRIDRCFVGVSFDGAPCGNGRDGIHLNPGAADGTVTATVAGNNTQTGISTYAPRTRVNNCSAGVSFDGAPCGNGQSGIFLDTTAIDSNVTATVAGNNTLYGIATLAPKTRIDNCSIGASFDGTPGGNGQYGIYLDTAAVDSNVTATVVGSNTEDGIRTYAPRTRIDSCSVGVSFDGAPCGNGQDGINLYPAAVDSNVTATVVGNNTENGIRTQALRTRIDRCFVGVSFDGAPCGNGRDGIHLYPGAADGTVTVTVAGNNTQTGISTSAPKTRIDNCSVGVLVDGTPCGNGLDGIYLDPDAADSTVTTSVSGNHPQTGIHTLARNTSIVRNIVGPHDGRRRTIAPNLKYGIWVEENATQSLVLDNGINNSGWAGLRVDPDDAVTRNNTGNEDPNTNSGFALQACHVCDCRKDNVTATVAVSCHNKSIDFGPNFPNSFPANTTRIDLSNTKLRNVGWQQLRQVGSMLRVLDLSLNPGLDAVSDQHHGNRSGSPYGGLGQLVELNLDGTDLSQASNETVQPIAPQLRVLRLSNPSATPDDPAVSVNLTGTHVQLACLAWYDVSRCPAGYYDPVPTAGGSAANHRGGQCTRCPVGTFQPLVGATELGSCIKCKSGFVDGDDDPTTRCTASGFHVSNGWHPDLIAAPPATFTANEAYDLEGVDRARWTNAMLFNCSQTGKVVFVVEVVNANDTDATVYTNVKSGAATARVHVAGDWTLKLSAMDGSHTTKTLASWKVRVVPPLDSGPGTMVLALSGSLGGTLLLVLVTFGVYIGRRARQKRAENNTRRRLARIAAGTARFDLQPADVAEGGNGLPVPTAASTAVATAVALGCEDLVPDLLEHGADPAARHPETNRLVHATLLARPMPSAPVLLELFRAHCEIDPQIGALVRDPDKLVVLQQSLVALAQAQWRGPDGATPLHRVVDACRLQCLAEPAAVQLTAALLAEDRTLLTAVDGRSRTPAAVAAECDDADELERLLAVVVYDRYQLLRAEGTDAYEYRSATSVISRCRDLGPRAAAAIAAPSDVGGGGAKEMLVLKMMKDEVSWVRELQSRCAFEGSDAEATTVPVRSAVSIESPRSTDITLSPTASRRVHRCPKTVLQDARHELAFELMKAYPFAICMPLAERNLLEIIESERVSGQPIGVLAFTARKIAVTIDNLHKAGIAHSDIKPRNIVRTKGGAFRLIDFDMAFCTAAAVAGGGGAGLLPAAHASASKIRRSNAFAAPELVRWAEAAAAVPSAAALAVPHPVRLDIFSFGVTLYTMVAGAPLFEQSYDTLTTRALPTMLSWTGLSSDADAEAQLKMLHPGQDLTSLLDVLQWMLEADPANRPTSMAEVLGHAFFDSTGGTMREHFLVERIRVKLADPTPIRDCPSVMISYCWADTPFVLGKLVVALAGRVKGLWLDRLGGDQGMGAWARASMDRGVAGADVIIAVVSPKYTQSKNCGFELELCHKHKKEVIPIVLGLPFDDWCALKKIGGTELTTQFHDAATGDGKLFVDFTKPELFETKFHQDLLPRMVNKQQQMREAAQRQPLPPPPPHPGGTAAPGRWSHRAPPAGAAVQRSVSAAGQRVSPATLVADPAHSFVHNIAFDSSNTTISGGGGGGGGRGTSEDLAAFL